MFTQSIEINKSLLTNIIASGIVLVSFYIANPFYHEIIGSIGFFALSGALTNWLAIKMLFDKIPFIYGSGVIELQFQEFKVGIKQLVMQQFFTDESVAKVILQEKSQIKTLLSQKFEKIDYDKIFQQLSQTILSSQFGGMLNMMGGEKALEPLKEPIKEKLQSIVTELLQDTFDDATFEQVGSSEMVKGLIMQVENIVDARISDLTPQAVKIIIQQMIRKHLGWLVVWGGVFGGLIGLVKGLAI